MLKCWKIVLLLTNCFHFNNFQGIIKIADLNGKMPLENLVRGHLSDFFPKILEYRVII